MQALLLTLVLLVLPLASASAQNAPATSAATPAPSAVPTPARDPNLPPSEEQARAALMASPRHGEYVDVHVPGGGTTIHTWVVYPEHRDKSGVVIVIHETFGLSDWIRGVADQLAREGFVAVAPDLISGLGPNGGGTEAVASGDDAMKLVLALAPEEVNRRLDAVHAFAMKLPAANGKTATVGFCWGGGRSFAYAATQPDLDAAVVFYGPSPEAAVLAGIKAPVLGLYGGDDARVNTTIESAQAELKKLGKTYEPDLYEGAGHGFVRMQERREGANFRATQQAWPRALAFLRRHLM